MWFAERKYLSNTARCPSRAAIFYHFKRRTVHNMTLKYGFNNSAASMKCAVFNYFASVSTLWLIGWTRVLFVLYVCACMRCAFVCSAFRWLCFRFILFSLILWSTFVVNKRSIYHIGSRLPASHRHPNFSAGRQLALLLTPVLFVCPSVCASHVTVPDIETHFALHDRAMFLVSWGQISLS